MGIEGLQPFIEPLEKQTHMKDYTGKTVAVDGLYMLQRSVYGTTSPIIKGINTYVNCFLQYISMMKKHGVRLIVVFDGLPLPIKTYTTTTVDERTDPLDRDNVEGHHNANESHVQNDITFGEDVIRSVILKLRRANVQSIVAPYDANAQFAHLMMAKKIEAVVSDNLNLFLFGCSKLLYNLNSLGECVRITQEDIFKVNFTVPPLSLDLLRKACIVSGCNYLPAIEGIDLKKASLAFQRYEAVDQTLLYLMSTINVIPTDYDVEFQEAYLAFLYQWVYDMDTKSYVRLNSLPEGTCDHDFGFLGTKPTVKGLSLLKTKKNILKRKQIEAEAEDFSVLAPPDTKANNLAARISTNVIDYVHTVKENLPPNNQLMANNEKYTPSKGTKRSNESVYDDKTSDSRKRRVLGAL